MKRDRIVIGGSVGAIETLRQLLGQLPASFPAAILVVVHTAPLRHSILPQIICRGGSLPCEHATDGAKIEPGHVYVAPPDFHLLVEDTAMRLDHGPRENGHRPAVDPLFRSAAKWCGPRVVGVVISGGLDCGTAGLHAIRAKRGIAVVQEPADAICPDMPLSAIRHDVVDHVVPVTGMGALLAKLVHENVRRNGRPRNRPAANDHGRPSTFGCPECGGVLWEVKEGALHRMRCRVGHRYSPEGLEHDQSHHLDLALWASLRALEENVALCQRLSERAAKRNNERTARHFAEKAATSEDHASKIRDVLGSRMLPPPD
jgi:two-component system chemotaxis response regulator CheB